MYDNAVLHLTQSKVKQNKTTPSQITLFLQSIFSILSFTILFYSVLFECSFMVIPSNSNNEFVRLVSQMILLHFSNSLLFDKLKIHQFRLTLPTVTLTHLSRDSIHTSCQTILSNIGRRKISTNYK
jgi:hypothetical protein